MKKVLIIFLAIVVVFFIVLLAKDIIIKTSVEKGVEFVTGLKLNIGSLKLGIFKPEANIRNLALLNPVNFTDRTMVDMPEIYASYDLSAIIGGKIHLPQVRLWLKEFVVIKNAKGELNLDAFRSMQAQKEGKSSAEKTTGKSPDIKIDVLKLKIGKVVYKDYSRGKEPTVQEFNINLDEDYSNVNDPYALANLIIVKALMNTSIASLTNFNLKGLKGAVGGVFSGAQEAASTAVSTAQEAGKQAADTVKGLFKSTFSPTNQTE